MKEIWKFDEQDYEDIKKEIKRIAIRGIIYIDNKLLMIQSEKYQEYKFPGGGLEKGETHLDTLKREVLEETGYQIIPETIKKLGYISEIRKSIYDDNEVFKMKSYYYFCKVKLNTVIKTQYSGYEVEVGYHPILINPNEAYKTNIRKIILLGKKATWIKRDNKVLALLIQNKF